MSRCPGCGSEPGIHAADCAAAREHAKVSTSGAAGDAAVSIVDRLGGQDVVTRIAAYAGGFLLCGVIAWYGGPWLAFLLFPTIAGVVVTLAKPQSVRQAVDKFGAWTSAKAAAAENRTGRTARYFSRPVLSGFGRVEPWTAGITDEFARCGTRLASYFYLWYLILLGLYVAVAVVVAVALIVVAVFVVMFIIGFAAKLMSLDEPRDSSPSTPSRPSMRERLMGTRIMEAGILGDSPTGLRVDDHGRVLEEGILSDAPCGLGLDSQGRVVREGLLSDSPSGVKVNDDGRIVSEGLLSDAPTGYRINEKGELVREGLLSDAPTGITFKKERGPSS